MVTRTVVRSQGVCTGIIAETVVDAADALVDICGEAPYYYMLLTLAVVQVLMRHASLVHAANQQNSS